MKKLIAAAVAAAVIAPATTMAAGPTLYGKIHTSIDMKDNNGDSQNGSKYDEWSVNSNSSRIGVKGSEDLGNGMKVGYLIEWGVDMDGDGGDLSERNRAVTLSGDWGTALVGKWDTPYKVVGRKFDLFGDKIGDTRNLTNTATSDNRANNVVAYVTPNMNGFSATVAYVFDALSTPDNSDNNAWSFNAIYNNGPLMVGLGYADYSDDGQATTTTTQNAPFILDATGNIVGTTTTVTANDTDNATSWRIGGSYKMGDFKVLATYVDMESSGFVKNMDTNVWTLGGSYAMGNNTIKVQYADRDEWDNINDSGSDMWTIGLDHAMSKRTSVYVAYASVDNDDNSTDTPWERGSGHDGTDAAAGVAGEDADAFSVGIIHKF